jgi:7-cyano-7-deazaguanine synthase
VRKKPLNIGVLFSGGLDSAALIGAYARSGAQVWPIYVRCGLRWESAEIRFAERYLKALHSKRVKPLTKLDLLLEDAYQSNWSKRGKIPGARSDDREVFLPARNLLLCIKAMLSLYAKKVDHLALATLKGNPFDDATSTYFQDLESVLQRSFQRHVHLHTPFRGYSKAKVIQDHRDLPLEFSLSCINPKGIFHCGKCNKCAERKNAFAKARVPDRTIYLKTINR